MKIQAYQKYIRISPRKLKLMADSVKNMDISEMIDVLKFTNKKSALVLAKVLKQARANAKQKEFDIKKWKIKAIQVLKGPTYKRWRAVSRGRAHSIMKRTSHLRVVLKLKEDKISKKVKNEAKASEKNTSKVDLKKTQKPKAKQKLSVKKTIKTISSKTKKGHKKENGTKS